MALLLMGVRLIRSSQVLASFRRTHVLKLSLPRQLHMLFPRHSTHSQAFLIIMQQKRLARTKLLSPGGCIAMTPEKRWQMCTVHCIALFGHQQESYWRESGLQIQLRIVKTCFISWSDDTGLRQDKCCMGRKARGAQAQIKAAFSLDGWEAAIYLLFPTNCTPWLTCCRPCTTPW